jgi:hypothetical protein
MNQEIMCEFIAEGIARQFCTTGLDSDELLDCAMETFVEKVPEFALAPEIVIEEFSYRLGIALEKRLRILRSGGPQ